MFSKLYLLIFAVSIYFLAFLLKSERKSKNMSKTIETIKALCKEKGISLYRLEMELGFSNASLSRGRDLTESRLIKVADYFGVSLDYLTGRGSRFYANKETAQIAQTIFDDDELRLLFDTAKDARPEDIAMTRAVLLGYKRKAHND